MNCLVVAQWNANGITNHKNELSTFLNINNIDIMLIVETHLTSKNNFKIYGYTCYSNNHPDDKACGGTAILIKNRIKHYPLAVNQTRSIQYTAIRVTDLSYNLNIAAVYCPPKYAIKSDQFEEFFKKFEGKTLIAGDFNAKSPLWGSRLTSPKGRQLVHAINKLNLRCISGGTPTYWPSDRRKIPDIIDFVITNQINNDQISAKTTTDLSSDHTPTIINVSLMPSKTHDVEEIKTINWHKYQELIKEKFNPNIKLKTPEDLDCGVEYLNDIITNCLELATTSKRPPLTPVSYSSIIVDLLSKKRKAKRRWQSCRSPRAKHELNIATDELKKKLNEFENNKLQNYLEQLTHYPDNYTSIWKTTKNIRKPMLMKPPIRSPNNTWVMDEIGKSNIFADHFESTFSPNKNLPTALEVSGPLNNDEQLTFTLKQVSNKINQLQIKKAAGIDNIKGKAIKALPLCGHIGIRNLFNAAVRLNYFPKQWK